MKRDSEKNKATPTGVFPDIHAGKKLDPIFTKELRAELTKLRRFRKPDGKVLELSYIQLLIQRIVDELLEAPELDVKLLEMVLNRLEGKVPEGLDFSGGVELRDGIGARDLLLQKLDRYLRLKDTETGTSES